MISEQQLVDSEKKKRSQRTLNMLIVSHGGMMVTIIIYLMVTALFGDGDVPETRGQWVFLSALGGVAICVIVGARIHWRRVCARHQQLLTLSQMPRGPMADEIISLTLKKEDATTRRLFFVMLSALMGGLGLLALLASLMVISKLVYTLSQPAQAQEIVIQIFQLLISFCAGFLLIVPAWSLRHEHARELEHIEQSLNAMRRTGVADEGDLGLSDVREGGHLSEVE